MGRVEFCLSHRSSAAAENVEKRWVNVGAHLTGPVRKVKNESFQTTVEKLTENIHEKRCKYEFTNFQATFKQSI